MTSINNTLLNYLQSLAKSDSGNSSTATLADALSSTESSNDSANNAYELDFSRQAEDILADRRRHKRLNIGQRHRLHTEQVTNKQDQ
jgi:hypothetical protein